MRVRRVGFIREKDDIKFLILYCMTFLTEPVTMASLADIAMCDGAFGYFEFADAPAELCASGHIKEEKQGDTFTYTLTYKGRATAEVFERELPTPVREAAKRSAARVVRALRRDAAILTELVTREDGTQGVKLAFMDDRVPVFGFELMVLDEEQGRLYMRNFRDHAETIYKELTRVLLQNYDEPDAFEKAARKKLQGTEQPKTEEV